MLGLCLGFHFQASSFHASCGFLSCVKFFWYFTRGFQLITEAGLVIYVPSFSSRMPDGFMGWKLILCFVLLNLFLWEPPSFCCLKTEQDASGLGSKNVTFLYVDVRFKGYNGAFAKVFEDLNVQTQIWFPWLVPLTLVLSCWVQMTPLPRLTCLGGWV